MYFIRCGEDGPIKIGLVKDGNISRRLSALQGGNHRPLVVIAYTHGTRATELALHRQFAAVRVVNEWFDATPELLALCDRLGHGGSL